MDKSRQNESSAIVFHMPDLHWEGYNFPRHRDPAQPWVLMTYESANSLRQRSHYKAAILPPPPAPAVLLTAVCRAAIQGSRGGSCAA